jgi:hypothetical protein
MKRQENRIVADVFKGAGYARKRKNVHNSKTNAHARIIGFLLLFAFLFSFTISPFSVPRTTVSVHSPRQIVVVSSNIFIGQFGNGTYYAKNLDNGKNYAIDLNYASTLINNAIEGAYAHNGGGTVQIGSGLFVLNETIVPKSNVYLQVSPSATIFENTPADLESSISLMACSSVRNFTLDGGIWNANKGPLSDHRDTGTWHKNFNKYLGVAFYGDSINITVKNIVLENVIGHGIDFMSVVNGYICNCTVINSGDNPITVESTDSSFKSNTTVRNCYVRGGQDVGINSWTVSNVTLECNTVTAIVDYNGASHWGIAAEYSSNINIIGNNVSNCDYNIVSTSNNVLIANNTIDGTQARGDNYGIQIQTATNNIVSNNIITNVNYPLATWESTQTIDCKFINNICGVGSTATNGGSTVIGGMNVTVNGGTMYSTDYDGCISLRGANTVNIIGVTFLSINGISDYGMQSTNVYITQCNFTGLIRTKTSLTKCQNVTIYNNVGYP